MARISFHRCKHPVLRLCVSAPTLSAVRLVLKGGLYQVLRFKALQFSYFKPVIVLTPPPSSFRSSVSMAAGARHQGMQM
ncbi:hypothetical protein B0H12DRAFT_299132 [Mycena haematopus]|nr:hypothetical protein B0H12DRAFT_299132 [Mycena haematopus]